MLASVIRSVGEGAFRGILEGMKDQQRKSLEAEIESKPTPSKPKKSPTWGGSNLSVDEALRLMKVEVDLKASSVFTERDPVDLVKRLNDSDAYNLALTSPKWSEIVAGLTDLVNAAGERPYKLDSNPDYGPVFGTLIKFLGHTHANVAGKAMDCLTVLFEGLGPHPSAAYACRAVLGGSSNKKIAKAALKCLISCYGNAVGMGEVVEVAEKAGALDDKVRGEKKKDVCRSRII